MPVDPRHQEIVAVLRKHLSADRHRLSAQDDLRHEHGLQKHAHLICAATYGAIWEKPKEVEDDLEELRRDLRSVRERIISMDSFAKWLARCDAAGKFALEELMDEAAAADHHEEVRQLAAKWAEPIPQAELVDVAAINAIRRLEASLPVAIEKAVSEVNKSPTRPANWPARLVALKAARAYKELVSFPGRSRKNPLSTPLGRMVRELFVLLEIRSTTGKIAGVESPLNWALDKLCPNPPS